MNAFDQAWDLLKVDTGMWEEIYAPLYELFGGRGNNPYSKAIPLDFMQTKDLPHERHFQSNPEKDKLFGLTRDPHIEELMESIMEHGMLGRDSPHWRYGEDDPQAGQKRFDSYVAGKGDPGRQSIPEIGYSKYSDEGWNISEGNHRTAALRNLGAPYIPVYASSSGWGRMKPYTTELPMGPNMRRWMGLDEHGKYQEDLDDYGITASLGRRSMPVPPSFMFGRELVPGMGKLVPDLENWEQMPLDEARSGDGWWGKGNDPGGRYRKWQNNPKWRIENLE